MERSLKEVAVVVGRVIRPFLSSYSPSFYSEKDYSQVDISELTIFPGVVVQCSEKLKTNVRVKF